LDAVASFGSKEEQELNAGLEDYLALPVVGIVFRIAGAVQVYSLARAWGRQHGLEGDKKVLSTAAFVLLSVVSTWRHYGTAVEDADSLFGGGQRIETHATTRQERSEEALMVLLLLGIPAFLGLASGLRQATAEVPRAEPGSVLPTQGRKSTSTGGQIALGVAISSWRKWIDRIHQSA
jgi:hypothetical protein